MLKFQFHLKNVKIFIFQFSLVGFSESDVALYRLALRMHQKSIPLTDLSFVVLPSADAYSMWNSGICISRRKAFDDNGRVVLILGMI